MKRRGFKGVVMPDVRGPLDQRERPLNNRKGIKQTDELKKSVHCQMNLFGNPFELPNNELPDLDPDLASMMPDYIKKRIKNNY